MKKLRWISLLLLALRPQASWAQRPSASELLAAALTPDDAPYEGRVSITGLGRSKRRAEEGRVHFEPPDRYRWEFLDSQGRVARSVVSDGAQEEVRLRGLVLAGNPLQGPAARLGLEKARELVESNYEAVVSSADRVAGRQVWVLQLRPKTPGKPRHELWLDQETEVVLEARHYDPEGRAASLFRFVDFLPRPQAGALFETSASSEASKPHGLSEKPLTIEEVAAAVPGGARSPARLPHGFVFDSGGVMSYRKHKIAHLTYTDGLVVVSFFSADSPSRPSGRSKDRRVMQWRQGKRHLTLIGDLSPAVLRDLKDALSR